MTDLFETLLAKSAQQHNHVCPRQVIGVRMGLLAGDLLEIAVPQTRKMMLALVETDGCFADGVAAATGCTLGHRTMRLIDIGRVAATFVDLKSHRAVRIAPHAQAREIAIALVPEARSRWHAYLEAYQRMPYEQLLQAEEVEVSFSISALMSRPGVRVNCESCGEEIINEREVVRDGRVLCKQCAGEGYYAVVRAVGTGQHERASKSLT